MKECLFKTDTIGAKTLLRNLKNQSFETKLEVLELLALADDPSALECLSFLMSPRNIDPAIRERLVQLVTDRAHLHFRFALLLFKHLNQEDLKKIVPLIRHILSNETDPEILAATIKTAGNLALDTMVDDIAEFILYNDAALKRLAVQSLEKIGSTKALNRLEKAAATSKRDRNILDAILRIQEKRSSDPKPEKSPVSVDVEMDVHIRELRSRDINHRSAALREMSKNGTHILPILQKSLAAGIPDLTVTVLGLVSRTFPEALANEVLSLLEDKTHSAPVRFAAYEALEAFPCLESAAFVLKGLDDPAPQVRMAAARVLDRNPGDYIRAEVKERIESGTREGAQLAETLLDAHTRNLTDYLMISDTFSYMASNHLSTRASFSALENFIAILQARNLKSTAGKYQDTLLEKSKSGRHKILAVSPSGMRLAVYDRLIYQSGFRPVLFDNCQKAFETIMEETPVAVLSDLFMHDITGLEFTGEIRQLHPPKALPVLLCTLEQELVNPEEGIALFPPGPALLKDLVNQRPVS